MSIDVAVVGSCNLDLVVTVDAIPLVGQTVLGGDLAQIPGGKGANQAVATSRLGHSAAFIGRIGDDDHGSSEYASGRKNRLGFREKSASGQQFH